MALFVHLAPESRVALIRRNGIRRLRRAAAHFPGGVFAVPVTRNFYVSHQWLRELKRRNQGPIAAVYFRVLDDEQVWLGHYNQGHRWMSASEAVGEFMAAEDAQGWEAVIPRRIEPSEIHKTRPVPQVIGWRFFQARRENRLFVLADSAFAEVLGRGACGSGWALQTNSQVDTGAPGVNTYRPGLPGPCPGPRRGVATPAPAQTFTDDTGFASLDPWRFPPTLQLPTRHSDSDHFHFFLDAPSGLLYFVVVVPYFPFAFVRALP